MKAESQNVIQINGLISTEEAAEYLGKSVHNFNQHISKHIRAAAKYGKRNYYKQSDLDNWFAKHLVDRASANIPQEQAECS
jgi:predicted HTH domain antitoxin